MSQALSRCVNCLPGQRDVDAAIRTIGEASKRLLADSVSVSLSNQACELGRDSKGRSGSGLVERCPTQQWHCLKT